MPPNFTFMPALDYPKQCTLIFDITSTVHLPEKYTSGNLRYFQYCCITHPIPPHVSPKQSFQKKKKKEKEKKIIKKIKGQIWDNTCTHKSNTFNKHKTKSISECLNSQMKVLFFYVALLQKALPACIWSHRIALQITVYQDHRNTSFFKWLLNNTKICNKWWLQFSPCTAN